MPKKKEEMSKKSSQSSVNKQIRSIRTFSIEAGSAVWTAALAEPCGFWEKMRGS